MKDFFVSNVHKWQPLKENPKEKPKLEFADSLFKRRLSQITRMTIQVLHDLLIEAPNAKDYKQVFVSFRGEIEREFTINKGIIEDSEILPAGFSLSVFNTPIASATLCLGLKAGYSVIYPSKNNFYASLSGAASPILCGSEENVILVYADEYVPEQYGFLLPKDNEPLAFACILSGKKLDNSVKINLDECKESLKNPLDFLAKVQ